MADQHFEIPDEFKSQLRYVEPLDDRSDRQIIDDLSRFTLTTASEKNIWTFWHSGIRHMPAWSQRNICDLARINGPSWQIRVLDADPKSPNYALKYIEPELLPKCFSERTMDGQTVGPHQADMLRGAALWKYGGVWIDCGCIPLRKLDDWCWTELEDLTSPYRIAIPCMFDTTAANHFFAVRKGDVFIKAWHDYFCYLWKDRMNASGIASNEHLQTIIKNVQMGAAWNAGFQWKWEAPPNIMFEYIAQIQAWNVVAQAEEPQPGGLNGLKYFKEHVMPFDALTEDWPGETVIGWEGKDFFDVVATPLDADKNGEEYKRAFEVIWKILTTASMQKITRGGGLGKTEHFGTLLDKWKPEKDAPKTFFDLLRYGSVHFEQIDRRTRLKPPYAGEALIRGPLIPA